MTDDLDDAWNGVHDATPAWLAVIPIFFLVVEVPVSVAEPTVGTT